MNYNIVQIIISVFVLFIGLVLKYYPPKAINGLYGFRTELSMKNLNTWNKGNEIAANLFIKGSMVLIFIKLIQIIFIPNLAVFNTIIFLVALVTTLILSAVLTQIKLKKIFNSDGNKF